MCAPAPPASLALPQVRWSVFFADGVAGAVFGHGEAFYFFDDVVAQFIECFLARGVYSALLFYFAEEEREFCGLFIHGICGFSWLKVRL